MISIADLKKAVVGKRVLIDSNIIIYLTDSIKPYDGLAQNLFQMIEEGQTDAVISIVSIIEVIQGPLRKGYRQIAEEVKDYLVNFPNCVCRDISLEVLDKIGDDDRIDWSGLRTIDSIIIASALVSEAELIVSNDKHFRAALPKKMILSFDD